MWVLMLSHSLSGQTEFETSSRFAGRRLLQKGLSVACAAMLCRVAIAIFGLTGLCLGSVPDGAPARKLQINVQGSNVVNGQMSGGSITNSGPVQVGPSVSGNSGQVNFGINSGTMTQQNGVFALEGQLKDLLGGIAHTQGNEEDFEEVTEELLQGSSHSDFENDLRSLRKTCQMVPKACTEMGKGVQKKWEAKLSKSLNAGHNIIQSVVMSAVIKQQCQLHSDEDVATLVQQGVCEAHHKWKNEQVSLTIDKRRDLKQNILKFRFDSSKFHAGNVSYEEFINFFFWVAF